VTELNKLIERGSRQPARELADLTLDRIDAHTTGNRTSIQGETALPSPNPGWK
jgi:hypothetical protein